jgi:hypothetical protein
MSKYQEIDPISRDEAEKIIGEGSPERIALTLVRLAYHEPDWLWVHDLCVKLSLHSDKWVRRGCAASFGHFARIYGKIDTETVTRVLDRLVLDPEVTGEAGKRIL